MAGKRKSAPRRPRGRVAMIMLPVKCISCGTTTTFRLPGAGPYEGGAFEQSGWSVLNEPEEGHVVFSCGPCFDEEIDAQEKNGHPQVRGEG
jgi:hypothetical protein